MAAVGGIRCLVVIESGGKADADAGAVQLWEEGEK